MRSRFAVRIAPPENPFHHEASSSTLAAPLFAQGNACPLSRTHPCRRHYIGGLLEYEDVSVKNE